MLRILIIHDGRFADGAQQGIQGIWLITTGAIQAQRQKIPPLALRASLT
jgi:hypothetical protein